MDETIVSARIRADGVVVEILVGGTERPFPKRPMRPMSEEEISAAAAADPDARPMSEAELRAARRIPRVKTLRRVLGRRRNSKADFIFHSALCATGSKAVPNRINSQGCIFARSRATQTLSHGRWKMDRADTRALAGRLHSTWSSGNCNPSARKGLPPFSRQRSTYTRRDTRPSAASVSIVSA